MTNVSISDGPTSTMNSTISATSVGVMRWPADVAVLALFEPTNTLSFRLRIDPMAAELERLILTLAVDGMRQQRCCIAEDRCSAFTRHQFHHY